MMAMHNATLVARTDFRLPLIAEASALCDKSFFCPCCGACLAQWGATGTPRRFGMCPRCGSAERQKAVCYALGMETPRALGPRRVARSALLAYFGAPPKHARQIEQSFPQIHQLLRLDLLVQGYRYERATIKADVQSIPLSDGALDGIIILHVLEHVVSLNQSIRQLHRVLAPGGFILHETPCPKPARAGDFSVLDCAAERKRRAAGETIETVCNQNDHQYAYSCPHLLRAFEAGGFDCAPMPQQIRPDQSDRFLGVDMPITPTTPGYGGRFSCYKKRRADSERLSRKVG